jgi:N-sulfoglucosamine sulfohydrolase
MTPTPLSRLSLALAALLLALSSELSVAGTAQAPRPNILFAIADDWSYGHAGAYGCSWVKTPAFDRVAEQGLLFHHAYTPNAKCAPSRASILTGRNSWQLKAAANHIPYFPPEFKTVLEALGEHGWFVGHTAKGWGPGVATNNLGQARNMTGKAFNSRRLKPFTTGISPNDYAANFTDFLDATTKDQPWCFWYGALEPHRGYEYGSGVAKGGKRLADVDRVPGYWPDNEAVRHDMLDYALEVEHFDTHLGRMLAELERRGLLKNTLVVVTSDHGMPFPRVKGQAYDGSNRVPLAMMWAEGLRQPGRVVEDYVSFIDIAPTFLELAGLKPDQAGMAPVTGRSLTDLLFSASSGNINPARDHVLIGKERHDIGRPSDWGYPIRGIVKGGMLYVRNFEPDRWPSGNPETGYLNSDGGATKTDILNARRASGANRYWSLCFGKRPAEELYDVRRDPDCLTNLAADPAYASARRSLEAQMIAELTAQNDPRILGEGGVFEAYPYAQPNRGFYERFMRGERLNTGWVNQTDFEPEPLD